MIAPPGRSWARWVRVGDLVHHLARGRLWYYGVPLRVAWVLLDRLIFAWWWYGQGYVGAARWSWYRFLEEGTGRLYARVYDPLWGWVYRNIGE